MSSLNFDEPRFPLSATARATGWNLLTLRDYMARGKFEWHETDSQAAAPGGRSLLSLRSVVRLGITFELWSIGVSPKDAYWAALNFGDVGHSKNRIGALPDRVPGHLFPDPYITYLVFKRAFLADVIAVKSGEQIDLESVMYDLFNDAPGAVAIVNVNRVWHRIMTALDVEA
ncbi:hypothetical protein [Sphingorhabdus lacus]|uniref:MerR family transcriptional regulator n=1 Tax=Sphingorhabdus lacus TaxID=392610 RepID=A0A6I6L6V5_9SPHN|nr:hypothetical protein [Sphingorhabdus lacus]QGY81775.1 hypothetical protein EUU25_14795 [Sphingorhabdus lacus]